MKYALVTTLLLVAPATAGDQSWFVCPPGKTEVVMHFYPDDESKGRDLSFSIMGKDKLPPRSLFRVSKKGVLFYRGKRCEGQTVQGR